MLERPRLMGRCISRGLVIVLPRPLGRVAVLGDEVEGLIALRPTVAPVLLLDRRTTLHHYAPRP
jgi:hypothetical protein